MHTYMYIGDNLRQALNANAQVRTRTYADTDTDTDADAHTHTLFKIISGARYSGVPQRVQVLLPGSTCFENPKSYKKKKLQTTLQFQA